MTFMKENREYETTLIITGENALETLGEISALESVGSYSLSDGQEFEIHDIYFDTKDGDLGSKKIAFRLRCISGKYLLTVKGPSISSKNGLADRLEVEKKWSKKSVKEMVGVLEKEGVRFQNARYGFNNKPEKYLVGIGFKVIQDRTTKRVLKDVIVNKQPVAELAADRTTYNFNGRKIHHMEIEIEAKHDTEKSAVLEITKILEQKFDTLKPWKHGKLPTGKMVMMLLGAGGFSRHIDSEGALLSSAYLLIDEKISALAG